MNLLKYERQILENLSCNFFPKIYDFKIDKLWNRAYLFMENIQGQTLDKFIVKNSPLSMLDIHSIFSQLWTIIKYLHDRKIWHRDIKPQNIIVTEDREVKLIDFNICTKWGKPTDFKSNTVFYTQISTPLYAAPEIYTGLGYTQAIDIWGLGVIGYLLAEGNIDESDFRKYKNINRAQKFKDFVQISTSMSDSLKAFITKCLEEKPEDRPTTNDTDFELHVNHSFINEPLPIFEELKEVKEDEY